MECNKDEAIRAKEIAEKKMQSNDFEGAKKIALKAKKLYPELENITQMLTICDVHCSAQSKLHGSENNWYSVLQVEKLADQATIKKQYRRLALILHPDKNRFPGAEGAFKLICEANALLSDQMKKSIYDSKIRGFERFPPANPSNHHMNRSSQLNKQFGAQSFHASNGVSRENQYQAPKPTPVVFQTCCPFCKGVFRYHRQFINNFLQCPTCKKGFAAHEWIAQDVPPISKLGRRDAPNMPSKSDMPRPAVSKEKVVSNQAKSGIGGQNAKVPLTSRAGSRGTANKKTAQSQPSFQKGCGSGSTKGASAAENSKTEDADMEDPELKLNLSQFSRRSGRKHRMSYKETNEDDHARPLKKAQSTKEAKTTHGNKSSFTTPPGPNSGNKETASARSQEGSKEKNDGSGKESKMKGVVGGSPGTAADKVELTSDPDLELSSSTNSDSRCYECPDPDFSDFDKLRDETLFCVNQFWACYDDTFDGMPRYYAKVTKVTKVFASPFELQFKWLEAVPIDDSYESWVDEGLPVGCGSFKLVGRPEKVSGCLSFSHQVHCQAGKKKGSLFIYPSVGEVWALFTDWDISWSSKPKRHKDFRYEVVEVVSDFASDLGIKVCYLEKVAGFVSLFQRSETTSFVIGPLELYRFSHCIPSCKMSGAEREGVPIDSFELDPAALPMKPDGLCFPNKASINSTPHKMANLVGDSKLRRSPRVNAVSKDTS